MILTVFFFFWIFLIINKRGFSSFFFFLFLFVMKTERNDICLHSNGNGNKIYAEKGIKVKYLCCV
jgi:hypothetical protein